MLVGHADPAVHLHAFVAAQVQRVVGLRLRQRRQGRGVVAVFIQRHAGGEDSGAGYFDLAKHQRRAMLQRLEGADGDAELFAVLEVLDGAFEGFRRRAQHFRAQAGAGAVQHRFEDGGAAVHRTQHRARRVVQLDDRGVAAVHHDGTGAGHTGRIGRHEEQRDPAAGARHHDQRVGDVPVQHERLPARQPVTRAVFRGTGRDRGGGVAGAFFQCEREQMLTGDESGKVFGLLILRSRQRQEGRTEQRGAEKRRGGERAPRGFHHLRQAGDAEVRAAVVFRDQEAGPAEFGHVAPQRAREAVFVVVVPQFAQRRDGRFLAEEFQRGVAHHLGFGGKHECHGG